MKYRALLIQTAQCVVEFDAPESATQKQLEEAAYNADTPTLCHQCADSRNQSLDINGEWEIAIDDEGNSEIHVDE